MSTKGVPLKFTAARRAIFLQALATHGFVTHAAKAAGVHRNTALQAKDADPAFAALWADALAEYTERLEAEADRRAYEGVDEPVFYQGEACGKVRKYSDTLLIFRLKGLRPEVYAERQKREVAGEGGGPVQVETSLTPAAADLLKRILDHDQD